MPRFPVYQAQRGLEVGPAIQARPTGVVDPLGPALEVGARAAFGVEDAVRRSEERDARATYAATMADARLHWTQRRIEMEQGAAPGAPGFTPALRDEFKAWRDQKLQGLPSDRARELVGLGLSDMEADLVGRGMEFEARSRIAHRTQQLGEAAQKAATAAFLDPRSAGTVLEEQRAAILGAEDLPETTRRELASKLGQEVALSAFRGLVERDPHGAAARLQSDDPLANEMDPQARAVLTNQAQTEIRRRESEAKAEARAKEIEARQARMEAQVQAQADVATRAEDQVALAAAGQPVKGPLLEADFVAAYGDKRGPKLWASFDRKARVAEATGRVAGLPADQVGELLQASKPDPSQPEGFGERAALHAELLQAVGQDQEARTRDPAGYVRRHVPGVDQAFADAASGDPTALRYAAAKSIAAQRELGIPDAAIRPLDGATSEALARSIVSAGDPQAQVDRLASVAGMVSSPTMRARLLAGMEKAGLPEGSALVAARAVETDPDARGAAARLWRDLQAGKVELPSSIDNATWTSALDDASADLVEAAGMVAAMTGDGTAVARAQSLRTTLERSAKVRANVTGEATSATAAAARDLMGGVRYLAREDLVAGEVPASMDPEAIVAKLQAERAAVSLSPEELASSLRGLRLDGTNPERLAALVVEEVRTRGRWIANGSTATLFVPIPDGTGTTFRPLRRADGSAWSVDLAELSRKETPTPTLSGALRP